MEPDGKLLIEISNELAAAWGLARDDCQTVTYPFRQMVTWKEAPHGLMIRHNKNYEGGASRTIILWHQILSYEVHGNSEEYIQWKRSQRDSESSPSV